MSEMSNFLNRRIEDELTKLVKEYIESNKHLEQMLADTFKDFTCNKKSNGPEIFGQGPIMYFLSKQKADSLKAELERIDTGKAEGIEPFDESMVDKIIEVEAKRGISNI